MWSLPAIRHWLSLAVGITSTTTTIHRTALYNPIDEATTFHFFYGCASRYARGGRVVLDVATVGVFLA